METIYKKEIFELAKNQEDKIFYNSSEKHAAIVHQAIASSAKKYICIYSSCLCTEISNNDEYCRYIDEFLSKDKERTIRIILTDYSCDFAQKPIAKVLKKYPDQVSIKKFEGSVVYNNQQIHFTIADDRMFRLETDIKQHLAYGNFNAPDNVMTLKTLFDKINQSPITQSCSFC